MRPSGMIFTLLMSSYSLSRYPKTWRRCLKICGYGETFDEYFLQFCEARFKASADVILTTPSLASVTFTIPLIRPPSKYFTEFLFLYILVVFVVFDRGRATCPMEIGRQSSPRRPDSINQQSHHLQYNHSRRMRQLHD